MMKYNSYTGMRLILPDAPFVMYTFPDDHRIIITAFDFCRIAVMLYGKRVL